MPSGIRALYLAAALLLLAACATTSAPNDKTPNQPLAAGMTIEQVEAKLGKPEAMYKSGRYIALSYSLRYMSQYGMVRNPYAVVMENGRVVAFGPGTPVRISEDSDEVAIVRPDRIGAP